MATTTETKSNLVAEHTLLAKARKARFDDLPSFSGHPSEDVERFLKSIKNITKATDESSNHELLEIVRGKLSQSAGLWFDNHESSFHRWSDFENAFRDRYFSTTIVYTKFDKLKQRKQSNDETIVSYFDDVINLCREIDANMSERIIIQYLISGLHPRLKREVSRHESSMKKPADFLARAKLEQDLHDTFDKSCDDPPTSTAPYFMYGNSGIPSITAAIQSPIQMYNGSPHVARSPNYSTNQSSASRQNSSFWSEPRPSATFNRSNPRTSQYRTFRNTQAKESTTAAPSFDNCKVCNRKNHRTIDCFHKRTTGCFNCGEQHSVRDCTKPPHFQ